MSSRSWRSDLAGIRNSCADLLNSAINSGGVDGLPDSAEAAAMARIDGLAPEDRALVRRSRSARADVPSADAVLARR